ncbi:MAG: DNA alkylation repair protein [Candidatus Gracilibacteria bacterium]
MKDFLSLKKDLSKKANPNQAIALQRFFKTGPGQYGEGDIFIGIKVPVLRTLAKQYSTLPLNDLKKLIHSKIHEERMIALFILRHNFEKSKTEIERKKIVDFYLKHRKGINNWDLVDTSVPYILGPWLKGKDRSILYKFARSKNLWERRIAVLATFHFIKNNDYKDALALAEILLNDTHDLLHKAVGWMLREIGKRNLDTEEQFLKKYASRMPRTMFRYAIEKFQEEKRKKYLNL